MTKDISTSEQGDPAARYAAASEDSPGFLLWLVSTTWRRQVEAALAPLGLTHPQFVTLAAIGSLTRGGLPVSQAALGRHIRLDPNTMSQILRGLEKRHLIRRSTGKDTRAKNPSLTPEGADLVARAVPLVEAVDARFFRPMCGGQRMMEASLERLLEVAEGRDGEVAPAAP